MEHNNNITIQNKNVKKYKQLSHSERIKIQHLYNQNYNINQIAKSISRDYNTVKREIRRNGKRNQPSLAAKRIRIKEYSYNANTAQTKRDERYLRARLLNRYVTFLSYTKENINSYTTLEEIRMNFIKKMNPLPYPCLKTMYNWAHKGIITTSWGAKPVKKQTQKHTEAVEGKRNIKERELDFDFKMNDYTHEGHYEIDTIYNGDKLGGALTLNERSTRRLYAIVIKDRKATTINKALRKIIATIGEHNIKSITSDNGKEFSYTKVIEVCYNLKWYYCDPYSSWQRGQNERLNRDVRKYLPKGSLITNISEETFKNIITAINNKPRRIFDGLSSYEYSLKMLSKRLDKQYN